MDRKDPNKLFKSLAKLKGIKANINVKSHTTQEKYVNEYNETVKSISESINDDLDTFLVPKKEIQPKVTSTSPAGKRYSADKWTETQLFLTQVDSLIDYLEMLLEHREPKRPFGFSAE